MALVCSQSSSIKFFFLVIYLRHQSHDDFVVKYWQPMHLTQFQHILIDRHLKNNLKDFKCCRFTDHLGKKSKIIILIVKKMVPGALTTQLMFESSASHNSLLSSASFPPKSGFSVKVRWYFWLSFSHFHISINWLLK